MDQSKGFRHRYYLSEDGIYSFAGPGEVLFDLLNVFGSVISMIIFLWSGYKMFTGFVADQVYVTSIALRTALLALCIAGYFVDHLIAAFMVRKMDKQRGISLWASAAGIILTIIVGPSLVLFAHHPYTNATLYKRKIMQG